MKKPALYLVAFFVLVPTTLVAAPLTVVGMVVAWTSIFERSAASPPAMFSALTLGFLGLASMWVLFFHYLKSVSNPPASHLHCIALLAGAAVSLALVVSSGGSLLFRALFFGWPLTGAVFF
ncbi:hypothetical protein [Massilia sp. Bi118]|uniref:hypothetical protein n=1 Tax=Massilia sp. Bi118 TaxID=2822346 RepID=UPI001E2E3A06|nr:hypothetical protein [Massilia sp. Bi118]